MDLYLQVLSAKEIQGLDSILNQWIGIKDFASRRIFGESFAEPLAGIVVSVGQYDRARFRVKGVVK